MSEIELKYAPRKCKHFCCGDCTLDLKSCGHDINDDAVCIEKYNKFKQALQEIKNIAEPRFVCGLNEEADIYNKAMDRIQQILSEVDDL